MMTMERITSEDASFQQRVLQRMIELTYPKETEPNDD